MLSTLWSSNEFFTTPFPTNGEPPYFFQEDEPGLSPNLTEAPVLSTPGSDNTEPMRLSSNYNANDKENRKRKCFASGSDEPSLVDERKQRRMISNRNSARRSRMRKQKNLEDLRNQVNQLEVENRDMMNRLRVMTHHSQILLKQNELIRSESVILQQKLLNLHQTLVDRQLDEQLSSTSMQLPPINNYNPHELLSHNNGICSM